MYRLRRQIKALVGESNPLDTVEKDFERSSLTDTNGQAPSPT